ncbi:dienelactone hydrolase family protein [Chelatococcus reniformis]|uniref:Carboxymethylenebutenolidase n=1 Tax=Chelatococcus reniformis TaxID=1494448 RepID=A0A916XHN9_9HYPH|nr:dienelactone hydrolase family protein [Chelatococcus reniformis]GGC74215.1 carboxymethylenebutenolidase [Chelatococcus reniformis]
MTQGIKSETITLTAADGATLSAYKVGPAAAPRGGIVVIQEIFGVNGHIRNVADGFARNGYLAVAPALYDRLSPGTELGYTADDMQPALDLRAKSDPAKALLDIAAAVQVASAAGPVGVVGYCWGGYLSWLSAAKVSGVSAAVVYYGGGIGSAAQEEPRCPVLGHFGERDKHIPILDVQGLAKRYPERVEIHIYAADHGFNCDERASYDAASTAHALERTLAFFGSHLRG